MPSKLFWSAYVGFLLHFVCACLVGGYSELVRSSLLKLWACLVIECTYFFRVGEFIEVPGTHKLSIPSKGSGRKWKFYLHRYSATGHSWRYLRSTSALGLCILLEVTSFQQGRLQFRKLKLYWTTGIASMFIGSVYGVAQFSTRAWLSCNIPSWIFLSLQNGLFRLLRSHLHIYSFLRV